MTDTQGAPSPDRRSGGNRISPRKPAPPWTRRLDLFEASVRADVANLSLEIVLRDARGPGGKPMWYFGRKTRNGAVYVFSTKCREEHRPLAELMLKRFKQRQLEILAGKIFPGSLSIATVLRDHLANLPRRNRMQQATAQRKDSVATTLLRFFGETELGHYTRDMSLQFEDWFAKENDSGDAEKDREEDGRENDEGGGRSARSYLALLREAANDYCRRMGIEWWEDRIFVPKRTKNKRERWLKKHELCRLLWACLGCIWDPATQQWRTREIIDADGKVRTTRRMITDTRVLETRRFLSRLIRWAIRSGARHDVYLNMTWGREPLLSSIEYHEDGESWFHRRGYDERDNPKQRPSTLLTRQMKLLAWIWARQDGQARVAGTDVVVHRYVIRRADGSFYPGYATREWRELRADAGLQADVIVHTLKHTSVSYCHAKGYSIEDTAIMLGTTENTLRNYYTHWGNELRRRARDAFDDPQRLADFRKIRHEESQPGDRVPRSRRPRRPLRH